MQKIRFRRCGAAPRAIVISGAFALLAPVALADEVAKDHVTQSSLWSGTARISNWDDTGSSIDFFAAAAFTGNGADLLTVEGIFWSVDSLNVPNGADWADIDFRLIFYADVAAYQADPRNGSETHTIDVPTNADWLTPVATFVDPDDGLTYNLHRFTFDVSALGITTTSGAEQLVALTPTGDSLTDGETGMMFSNGGAGAIGTELDRWTRFADPKLGPETLQAIGAPHDYFAYRLTLDNAPCPADIVADGEVNVSDLLNLLGLWGPCPAPCAADINQDGNVDVTDLLALLGAWGPC